MPILYFPNWPHPLSYAWHLHLDVSWACPVQYVPPDRTLESVCHPLVPRDLVLPPFSILLNVPDVPNPLLLRLKKNVSELFLEPLSLMCLQISWSSLSVAGPASELHIGSSCPMSLSSSLDQWATQSMLSRRCQVKSPRPIVEAHFKTLLMSHSLVSCWSKQVSWPRPKLKVGKYTLPSKIVRPHISGMGMCTLPRGVEGRKCVFAEQKSNVAPWRST